ncbi:4-hydroxybenzoate octaprenyltransferase [Woeseiaceae bacterium]|mgnify:CR=1 FL=1|jgi:4-hydroxybenzoate polyprenyltransferase|nr:4-hydroxybenzoate octaprenyltransferase [Woeseiaceae bacterium]MDB2543818.1 4-hydroxybenzoate octaprenyltransferase [Woeseiaceae bacterium]|tara:strand:+ start:1814 stop:2680 length:867 start_codon:yes stop_codon:yes gene_type:complete
MELISSKNLKNYLLLMRLDKPIGIWLLMWPMLWSLWIASEGQVSIKILSIFLSGVIIMRSAGCVLNDFADRKIDPHVKRTQNRPIASGKVSEREAIILFIILMSLACTLIFFLNLTTKFFAIGGALVTVFYPFVKRVLSAPQLVLGIAFGWGVPMAFSAEIGHVPLLGWLIFFIAIIWALIYDTYYAMVDRDDDLNLDVKSTAILFGRYDLFIIGLLQCSMLVLLIFMAQLAALGMWVYSAIMISMLIMIYHQWLTKEKDRESCFKAFKHNHYIGMTVFIGIILHYQT